MSAKVERLVNLTIALLETRLPMSLDALRQRTGYYSEGDLQSARRMFERDKDDLRRLGVPVELRPIPYSDEQGYIVPRRSYELPDIDLDGEEVAALALALRMTGEGHAPLAFAKLAARAPDPEPLADAADTSTRVSTSVEPVDAVAEAVLHRTPVAFGYRTAAGAHAERRIDPYGVAQRRGVWYLIGRDHDRDAVRAFRFDRMTSAPREMGRPGTYTVPDDVDVASAITGPELATIDVTVAVAPRAEWTVALRGGRRTDRWHGDWPVHVLEGAHPVRDRSWLLGLGADVEVLDPPGLRQDMLAALRAAREAHRGDPVGTPPHHRATP